MNRLLRLIRSASANRIFTVYALASMLVVGAVMAGLGVYMERQLAEVIGGSIESSFAALANELRRSFDLAQPLKNKASLQNYALTHREIRAIVVASPDNTVLLSTDPLISRVPLDQLTPLQRHYRFDFAQKGVYRDIRYFNAHTMKYATLRLAFLFDTDFLTRLRRDAYAAPLIGEGALVLILLGGTLLIQRLWVRPINELARAIAAKKFPLPEHQALRELHLLARALNRFHTENETLLKAVYDKSITDPLTGLLNRNGIMQALTTRLSMARRHPELELAVLYIDLDGFKEVNDSFGHEMGDWVLQHVAKRLKALVRQEDELGRLGGDEFLLIMLFPARERKVTLMHMLQRLQQALVMRLDLPQGHVAQLSASIGVALFPENGEDANALLKAADMAMYEAKRQGRGHYHFFNPELAQQMERLQLISSHIGRSLENEDFYLVFQPKVDLSKGCVAGFEALARYRHPILGELSPAEFIPVVNRSVEAPRFIQFVVAAALDFLASVDQGRNQLGVSINVQRNQLTAELLDQILSLCQKHGLKPSQVTLELLEEDFFADLRNDEIFIRLAALGVRVSIDDFGTGYSSLSYLEKLDVDEIKVDRSFVTALEQDGTPHVLQAIAQISRALHLSSVVEGTETARQVSRLHALGFDLFQGYYFARPLRADEAAAWLADAHALDEKLQAVLRAAPSSA